MTVSNVPRVLAFALDAAEPTLIQRMIEQGELPAMKSLLSAGRWLSVKSPADIGSGSVWPTFFTGDEAQVHGLYGEWCWEAERMGLKRVDAKTLIPFWKRLAESQLRVGVLDIPFLPLIGLKDGFEVSEWGAHDLTEGRVEAAPERVAQLVSKWPAHPLSYDRLDSAGPDDYEGLRRLTSTSLEGIRQRGSLAKNLISETSPHLALIGFTEIHHTAHYLWNTVEPTDPLYDNERFMNLQLIEPSLRDIFREVDRQIGFLVDTFGAEATVMVFSLHGMRPCNGVPTCLMAPLLCEKGFSRLADWSSRTWTERGVALMAAVKRHSPTSIKKLYYKAMPTSTTLRLARPTMMPAYDWTQTRAFALPADQHGWIRINLKGREAQGIVSPEEYAELCLDLENLMRSLKRDDGKPLARSVIRTAGQVTEALTSRIPDLVVHWEDEVFASPLRIQDFEVVTHPTGQKYVGQHSLDGFCILRGAEELHDGDSLHAKDIHRIIERSLVPEGDELSSRGQSLRKVTFQVRP